MKMVPIAPIGTPLLLSDQLFFYLFSAFIALLFANSQELSYDILSIMNLIGQIMGYLLHGHISIATRLIILLIIAILSYASFLFLYRKKNKEEDVPSLLMTSRATTSQDDEGRGIIDHEISPDYSWIMLSLYLLHCYCFYPSNNNTRLCKIVSNYTIFTHYCGWHAHGRMQDIGKKVGSHSFDEQSWYLRTMFIVFLSVFMFFFSKWYL